VVTAPPADAGSNTALLDTFLILALDLGPRTWWPLRLVKE
jgi:hypothetical protein